MQVRVDRVGELLVTISSSYQNLKIVMVARAFRLTLEFLRYESINFISTSKFKFPPERVLFCYNQTNSLLIFFYNTLYFLIAML